MKIEEMLLTSDLVRADNKYISNGYFLIDKKYIKSKALGQICNSANLFDECEKTVPFEKGREFLIEVGTKCKLGFNYRIDIIYNDKYSFDYEKVKAFIKSVAPWDAYETFVVENSDKEPILKFFVEDEFIGCIMSKVER